MIKKLIENSILIEELIEKYDSNELNIEDNFGHIYLTYCKPEDKYYLGKKVYKFSSNVKLGKKELANMPITRGRKKTTKLVIKDSDWKSYYGSHPLIKKWISKYNPDELVRYIIKICPNKKLLTYYENKYQYQLEVIEPGTKFINDNISGTIYTKDFI